MQELILRLNQLVEAGEKKTTLEESIGLPKNSLSAVLGGGKSMPESWIPKIETFLATLDAPIAEPLPPPAPKTELVVDEKGLKEKPSNESMKRIREVISKCNADFGEGSVMFLGDGPMHGIEAISTGSFGLDIALGVGGLPRGRMVEIYGPESSGKTTIAIHTIAEAQKMGLKCLMIDAEHAFDQEYARNLGVKIEELTVSQPDYGEQALEIADRHISSGEYGVVVIDSVAALVPKAELEGEMGDSKMGAHARLMSQACRKLAGIIKKTNTLCIFINQLRNKIGIVYGSPETTPGGLALQFYSSIRLDVRRNAQIKDGDEIMGNRTTVKVIKNKVAPPYKKAEFDIMYGEGISKSGELVDTAVDLGIIKKAGSWYSRGDDKLGQGRESVKDLLKNNVEFASDVEAEIRGKMKQKQPA
jgi:recombination protein RecA